MGPRDKSFDPLSPDLWLEGAGVLRAAEQEEVGRGWDSLHRAACQRPACPDMLQAGRQADRQAGEKGKTPLEALLSLRSLPVKITALPQPESSEVTDTDKVVLIPSPSSHQFFRWLDAKNHSCVADEKIWE